MNKRRALLVIVACLLLGACESISYYGQAANGQLSLWWRREAIARLLSDPETDAKLKQRLALVLDIRDFATRELGLPDNNSYRYYVDVQRSHVVWNVFAANEFSTSPEQWCFPVAGCVSYRGYFSQQRAQQFAAELSRRGFDTYVGGVTAYSTLGWFDDPLLNTFLYDDDSRLAGLIFHELAHQQLYLPGDTTFNESFATVVEIAGVRRWLAYRGEPEQMDQFVRDQQFRQDFVQTLLSLRERLTLLYNTPLQAPAMREKKQAVIREFIANDYSEFKQRWAGNDRYDGWVADKLNNAKLVTLASYHQWLGAFQALLAQSGDDWPAYYQRAHALSTLDVDARSESLRNLSILLN